jgi:hypothetical protein
VPSEADIVRTTNDAIVGGTLAVIGPTANGEQSAEGDDGTFGAATLSSALA